MPDSLFAALDEYRKAVGELKGRGAVSEEARREHREKWLEILIAGISANPESRFVKQASAKAAGLANSLGRFDIAQEMMRLRLQVPQIDSEKLFWGAQLLQAAQHSGDIAKEDEAISVLGAAVDNLAKQISTSGDAGLAGEYVNACATLGEALMVRPDRLDEAERLLDDAITYARLGYGGPEVAVQSDRGSLLLGLLRLRLKVAAEKRDDSVASTLLAQLCMEDPGEPPPPSMRVLAFGQLRYPPQSEELLTFLEHWKSQIPKDAMTAVLNLTIGRLYFDTGKLDRAKAVFTAMEADGDVPSLLKLSTDYIRQGYGGEAGKYFFTRGMVHAKLREIDAAKECLSQLRAIAPNERDSETLYTRIVINSRDGIKKKPDDSNASQATPVFKIVVAVNVGLALAAVVLFLIVRRRAKRLGGSKNLAKH